MKRIPGFGDKYRITNTGKVLRRFKGDEYDWEEVATSPAGPDARVRLYKPGGGDRPNRRYVRELLRAVFGDRCAMQYIENNRPPEG